MTRALVVAIVVLAGCDAGGGQPGPLRYSDCAGFEHRARAEVQALAAVARDGELADDAALARFGALIATQLARAEAGWAAPGTTPTGCFPHALEVYAEDLRKVHDTLDLFGSLPPADRAEMARAFSDDADRRFAGFTSCRRWMTEAGECR